MDRNEALTLALFCIFLSAAGVTVWLAARRMRRAAAEDLLRRQRAELEREQELRERRGRVRSADDLLRAAAAVQADPKRAARVVSRMLSEKTEKGP